MRKTNKWDRKIERKKQRQREREREYTYRAEVGVLPSLQSPDLRREQKKGGGGVFIFNTWLQNQDSHRGKNNHVQQCTEELQIVALIPKLFWHPWTLHNSLSLLCSCLKESCWHVSSNPSIILCQDLWSRAPECENIRFCMTAAVFEDPFFFFTCFQIYIYYKNAFSSHKSYTRRV